MFKAIKACFEHSNLLSVTEWNAINYLAKIENTFTHKMASGIKKQQLLIVLKIHRLTRNTTTSFSTATTLIYPIGAGITAAAGTRLALQLIVL